MHPQGLAGADYSAIDKILEGSLVRNTCGIGAIYVRLAARSSNSGALDFMILNLNARSIDLMILSDLKSHLVD